VRTMPTKMILVITFSVAMVRGVPAQKCDLCYPAYMGDLNGVVTALKHHANVNARDKHGVTPLAYAVEQQRDAIGLLLLQRGAKPNATTSAGWTPLAIAAENGEAILGPVTGRR